MDGIVSPGFSRRQKARKLSLAFFFVALMLCIQGMTLVASAQSVPTSQDPVKVISNAYSTVDAAMSVSNITTSSMQAPVNVQSLLSPAGAHVSMSSAGQAVYQYSLSRIQVMRSWETRHSNDFSANHVWSTFQATSTNVHGSQAIVTGVETLHVDSTVKSNGEHPQISAEKQAEIASMKQAGLYIGVGQTNHGEAQINHTVTLSQSATGWVIEKDLYQDVLEPQLSADHQTLVKKASPANATQNSSSALSAIPALRTGFHYNRQGAINYAERWWNACNPSANYNCYMSQGVDCANFVSQSIYDDAGGTLPGDNTWYSVAGIGTSDTFVNAPMLQRYMASNFASSHYDDEGYAAAKHTDIASEYPGDLVFYSWDGGPIIDHTAISVSYDANLITQVDAHTFNAHRWYWDLQGVGPNGSDTGATYWFVMLANSH